MPRMAAATARCQILSAPTNPSTATTVTVTRLTVSTAMMIVRWLTQSAVMPPTRTNATRPTPMQVATTDSEAGSLSIAMTCNAITTDHMPSAKIDSVTAAISSRYSRTRKGASTRQPPV
nr:hypothetical protein CPGR_00670 [Mycolicibacterium fortuitum subsp. fortuitum DSM 46621 = ATCC 6841 = JCM 6387]